MAGISTIWGRPPAYNPGQALILKRKFAQNRKIFTSKTTSIWNGMPKNKKNDEIHSYNESFKEPKTGQEVFDPRPTFPSYHE